jgi:hypothetical protein
LPKVSPLRPSVAAPRVGDDIFGAAIAEIGSPGSKLTPRKNSLISPSSTTAARATTWLTHQSIIIQKGSLGLVLDLFNQAESNGKLSLDDAARDV